MTKYINVITGEKFCADTYKFSENNVVRICAIETYIPRTWTVLIANERDIDEKYPISNKKNGQLIEIQINGQKKYWNIDNQTLSSVPPLTDNEIIALRKLRNRKKP